MFATQDKKHKDHVADLVAPLSLLSSFSMLANHITEEKNSPTKTNTNANTDKYKYRQKEQRSCGWLSGSHVPALLLFHVGQSHRRGKNTVNPSEYCSCNGVQYLIRCKWIMSWWNSLNLLNNFYWQMFQLYSIIFRFREEICTSTQY